MLLVSIWSAGLLPANAFAQNEQGLVVIHAALRPQESQMALSLFFTVVDGNGRPLPQPNLESATIQLLGEEGVALAPAPAVVTAPQTPIYIALLLDASGSMAGTMAAVHEAAKAAIDQAPPNVAFAVIPFNDLAVDQELRPLSGFTTDHGLIKRDIDIVAAKQGGATCLYNATYKAIELLDSQIQSPEQRRGIILFTDGRDEIQSGQPCSQRTYEDVIARATNDRSKLTPIFTIGLQEGDTRIDPNVLMDMAKETNAYYAIGDRNSLGDLFREIMEGLNSQLVAFANILPRQGNNVAVLSVKVNGQETPLTTTFTFYSERGYESAELAPVNLRINGIDQYDSTSDSYLLRLAVDNPTAVGAIGIKVKDKENNTDLYELPPTQPASAITVKLNASVFKPGREYLIEVNAYGADGSLLFTQPEPNSTDKPAPVSVQTSLKHNLPDPARPVQISIQGASADFIAKQLSINLALSEAERVDKYAGFVRNGAGAQVLTFGPAVFLLPAPGQTPQLQVALSPPMLAATAPEEYTVVVQVWTKRDELASESEPFEFIVTPPPPPSFWQRIQANLGNRWVQLTMIIIVACVTGWVFLRSSLKKKPEPAEPLPIDYTDVSISGVAVQDSARLQVQLIRAPNQNETLRKVVAHFPCRIGRHEECEINLSLVTTDKRISRRHLEITHENGTFFIADLGTENGTFVGDERLEPHKRAAVNGATTVRLGPETIIKLQPQTE